MGYFARRFNVKLVLPRVFGEILDLCVDYVTYVFVPVLLLLIGGHLPGAWGMILAAVICLSALYHFADTASKTDDHCFVGFPAIWNIVAFYIFALAPPVWATSALVIACAGLTFVPWKWVHPMRVAALRVPTLIMTVIWAIAALIILKTGFPAGWLTATLLVLVAAYGIGPVPSLRPSLIAMARVQSLPRIRDRAIRALGWCRVQAIIRRTRRVSRWPDHRLDRK